MQSNEKTDLLAAIGKLDATEMRDQFGRFIIGATWINRNDVIELLMRWPALYPTTYHVVSTEDTLISPFPDQEWPTREQATKFANEDAPNGWAGKLTVVP